jgi:predicted enzyme related to lactoylglutathione lyase
MVARRMAAGIVSERAAATGRFAVASRWMGERSEYTPGTFCWSDLTTSDQPAAKDFYSGLLGWEAEDLPVGEGAFYSMMRLGGKRVAAIAPQPQPQQDAGVPPVWNSYVSVKDADAIVERAGELGGSVHAPAFDVMTVGRMAVIQDPHGAFFMVWQPRESIGAELVNAPGALVWNELASPDPNASGAFYGDLFGWTITPAEGAPMAYWSITNGEAINGGVRELAPGEPPNWLAYFGVEEIDAAVSRVGELGGKIMSGPIDIGIAKIAIAQDPQGAVFALYAGQYQP